MSRPLNAFGSVAFVVVAAAVATGSIWSAAQPPPPERVVRGDRSLHLSDASESTPPDRPSPTTAAGPRPSPSADDATDDKGGLRQNGSGKSSEDSRKSSDDSGADDKGGDRKRADDKGGSGRGGSGKGGGRGSDD